MDLTKFMKIFQLFVPNLMLMKNGAQCTEERKTEKERKKKTIDFVLIHPIRPQSTYDLGNRLLAETIMGAKVRHNPSTKIVLSHLGHYITLPSPVIGILKTTGGKYFSAMAAIEFA